MSRLCLEHIVYTACCVGSHLIVASLPSDLPNVCFFCPETNDATFQHEKLSPTSEPCSSCNTTNCQALPYFMVRPMEEESSAIFSQFEDPGSLNSLLPQLEQALESAMASSSGGPGAPSLSPAGGAGRGGRPWGRNRQPVLARLEVVRGVPFYGYHGEEKLFVKVRASVAWYGFRHESLSLRPLCVSGNVVFSCRGWALSRMDDNLTHCRRQEKVCRIELMPCNIHV